MMDMTVMTSEGRKSAHCFVVEPHTLRAAIDPFRPFGVCIRGFKQHKTHQGSLVNLVFPPSFDTYQQAVEAAKTFREQARWRNDPDAPEEDPAEDLFDCTVIGQGLWAELLHVAQGALAVLPRRKYELDKLPEFFGIEKPPDPDFDNAVGEATMALLNLIKTIKPRAFSRAETLANGESLGVDKDESQPIVPGEVIVVPSPFKAAANPQEGSWSDLPFLEKRKRCLLGPFYEPPDSDWFNDLDTAIKQRIRTEYLARQAERAAAECEA